MRRFQAALKNYLTKQMEKVNLELQELVYDTLPSHSRPSLATRKHGS